MQVVVLSASILLYRSVDPWRFLPPSDPPDLLFVVIVKQACCTKKNVFYNC